MTRAKGELGQGQCNNVFTAIVTVFHRIFGKVYKATGKKKTLRKVSICYLVVL